MTSTTVQNQLLHQLTSKKANSKNILQKGFTLVELMVVIVIVGILSAVALPQFMAQTQKARATEGTQTASSIAKQAAALYLESPVNFPNDTTCEAYAGPKVTDAGAPDDVQFSYACDGSEPTEFTVTATGTGDAEGTEVTIEGNLKDGTFQAPVVTTS